MNTLSRRNLLIIVGFLLFACLLKEVDGLPSPTFTIKDGDWHDYWDFDRNFYGGPNGYLPNIAYETVGTNKELAYSIGEWFKANYADKERRAVEILKFIQRWTDYGYDVDNVVKDGIPQEEWAWNADEMAHKFNVTTNTVAIGDCEDMAFLGATIYTAAGFDAAVLDAPTHVALLIWLPSYPNANYYWDIPNDGRGQGWIWVEATGEYNPLGWTPPDFNDGNWTPHLLGLMISNVNHTPDNPQAEDNVTVTASVMTAKASISQVLLNYSVQGGPFNALPMTLEGSTYEASIPQQPKDTRVDFYVSASDSEGNTQESDKSSYTVGAGGPEIPGFPWESIIIGLAIGMVFLVLVAKRKPPSRPTFSTCSLSV